MFHVNFVNVALRKVVLFVVGFFEIHLLCFTIVSIFCEEMLMIITTDPKAYM